MNPEACASMCQHVPACAGLCQVCCSWAVVRASCWLWPPNISCMHLPVCFILIHMDICLHILFVYLMHMDICFAFPSCCMGGRDTNHGLILPLLKTIMIKRRGSSEIPPTPRELSVSPLVYEKVYGKDIGARLRTESPERAVVPVWSLHVSSGAWECVQECSVGSPTFPRVL